MFRRSLSVILLLAGVTAAPAAVKWNDILRQPPEWYRTAEARAVVLL